MNSGLHRHFIQEQGLEMDYINFSILALTEPKNVPTFLVPSW